MREDGGRSCPRTTWWCGSVRLRVRMGAVRRANGIFYVRVGWFAKGKEDEGGSCEVVVLFKCRNARWLWFHHLQGPGADDVSFEEALVVCFTCHIRATSPPPCPLTVAAQVQCRVIHQGRPSAPSLSIHQSPSGVRIRTASERPSRAATWIRVKTQKLDRFILDRQPRPQTKLVEA